MKNESEKYKFYLSFAKDCGELKEGIYKSENNQFTISIDFNWEHSLSVRGETGEVKVNKEFCARPECVKLFALCWAIYALKDDTHTNNIARDNYALNLMRRKKYKFDKGELLVGIMKLYPLKQLSMSFTKERIEKLENQIAK